MLYGVITGSAKIRKKVSEFAFQKLVRLSAGPRLKSEWVEKNIME